MPPKGSSKKANVKLAPVKPARKLNAVQVDDETPLVSSGRGKRLRRNSQDEMASSPRDAKGVAHYDLMGDDSLADDTCMDAVVKVFCIHTEPNFSLPWQRKRQYASTSTGFAIGGKRLLTNAHSVKHYTQVKVKRRGSDTKFVARVLSQGTECDLALLEVEDEEFWEGMSHLEFGILPRLQDAVLVVGYPIGGDTVSVTSGVVSRIEVTAYAHGASELLGVQIDAAINSGNSGGPALNSEGQCVGVAFQSMKHEDAENIGYIIPTPVIEHFVKDYAKNGKYTGFPALGIEWQQMENPHLRSALGMKAKDKGVLIRRVEPLAPASKVLKREQILMAFNGIKIANDGTVPFRHGERINFSYLVSQKYTSETATLEVLQDGKPIKVEVELKAPQKLVPVHIKGQSPSYLVVGGLVFAAVSVPYLRSEYGKEYDYDAPVKLLDKLMHAMADDDAKEIVVLSQVLAADVNVGYEEIVNTQVMAFNGTKISTLAHLAQLMKKDKSKYLRFDLDYNQTVVLDAKQVKATAADILATHCIPDAMSEDLRDMTDDTTEA